MTHLRSALHGVLLAGAVLLTACGQAGPELPTDADSSLQPFESTEDFATALAVHQRHGPDLMKIEGVVGTGLAAAGDDPRIRVFTVHGNVRGIPDHAEGVPIERVVTGLILAGGARDLNNPATRERPAPNGFSLGHPDITAGTLGAVLRGAGDVCYALSNNHILADNNNASIGDNALQPGAFDGGQDPADAIGTLADYEPIDFSADNEMDAAIAELFDASQVTGVTPSYAYGAPGTSPVSASIGTGVQKFGRTTGHTTGSVAEVNVTVEVCYETRGPFRCVQSAIFTDQFTITPGSFSDGGDSGSLIVTNNGSKNPVGLLFAGSDARTIASRIQPVLGRFGAVIEPNVANCSNGDGEPPANQAPAADFSFSVDGLAVAFTDESSDPDGSVVAWSWSFGDGGTSTQQHPSHTYAAGGDYAVSLTVTDDDGATDSTNRTVSVSDEPGGGEFTLSVDGRKVQGRHTVDLAWSGADGSQVDIYRNGSLLTTTANDGAHTDATNNRGQGSYTYEVCEAGTSTCSNEATAQF